MTKNEERIRAFFKIDEDEEKLRKFFESVNSVMQENDGGFDGNAVEITNILISRLLDFDGSSRGKDEDGFEIYSPVEENQTYDFCAESDYAQKILNDESYTIEKLQEEITRDIDEGNDDIEWEQNAGYGRFM